jgi:hypothetical protein
MTRTRFGMRSGVSEFDGNTWTHYTALDGLVLGTIQVIAIEDNDTKWFGSEFGLSEFREDEEIEEVEEIVPVETAESIPGGEEEEVVIVEPETEIGPGLASWLDLMWMVGKAFALIVGFILILVCLLIYRKERRHG